MNWVESKVGDFCPFVYGKAIKKEDQLDEGFPVYGSNGVYTYSEKPLVGPYAIIIGRKGSVGKLHLSKQPCWVSDTAFYVKFDSLDEAFFTYYLLSTLNLENMNTDAAVPGLNRNNAHRLGIKVPDQAEHRASLISPLKNLDEKMLLNRQTNQTLEHMAQAIFKSWFVDFEPTRAKIAAKEEWAKRSMIAKAGGSDNNIKESQAEATFVERAAMAAISGRAIDSTSDNVVGALAGLDQLNPEQIQQLKTTAALFPDALVDSELGEIPEGWEAKPLYETAEYINGNVFKAKDFSSDANGLPVIKIVELKSGVSVATKHTVGVFPKKYAIKNDDVLYSWSGSPETSLEVFKWFGGDAWLNQHIFKLAFETNEQKYFAYYLLKHMKPVLIATAQQKQTTGLGHITIADMKRLLAAYPENNLLCQFKEIIAPMYEQCSDLDKENIVLSNLRDTLLPKLLSGELKAS